MRDLQHLQACVAFFATERVLSLNDVCKHAPQALLVDLISYYCHKIADHAAVCVICNATSKISYCVH